MDRLEEVLTYNDVLLAPQYSDIKSRSEVSLNSSLAPLDFRAPIIASPMDTISEGAMGRAMGSFGGLAIVHRYNSIAEQCAIVLFRESGNAYFQWCSSTLCGCGARTSHLNEGSASSAASKLWK